MQLGIYSFGHRSRAADGSIASTAESTRGPLEAIQVADDVGLDFFGIGEATAHRRPPQAIGVAGDDPAAVVTVSAFVESLGFDPVGLGALRAGRLLEPTSPLFGRLVTAAEMRTVAGQAAGRSSVDQVSSPPCSASHRVP